LSCFSAKPSDWLVDLYCVEPTSSPSSQLVEVYSEGNIVPFGNIPPMNAGPAGLKSPPAV
jgi:hypothetical protein